MTRRIVLAIIAAIVPAPLLAEDKPLRAVIDAEIKPAWQREKIVPAGPCDDSTYLRRIYLDLIGTIPTYAETTEFLKDKGENKREKLVDKLLADPHFAAHQADVWDQVLFGRHPANFEMVRKRDDFKKWLAGKFAKNEPYDKWARELLRAEEAGSETFYVQFRNQPEDATVAVSRLFLGTQLQCARCHDHPFDKWTQKDFYGMTGFFVRLVVNSGGKRITIDEKSAGEVLFTGAVKDQKPGQKGEPVKPKFLGGNELKEPTAAGTAKEVEPKAGQKLPKPAFSRKEKIAAWVTARENSYFAKAVANRVWAQFMGRGLVHPVDDIGEKNQPSHPALLDQLAKQLTAHQFDLKWFIRELALSETYGLSGKGPSKDALPKWFEQARVRPLSAEEMIPCIRQATLYDAGDAKSASAPLPNSGDAYFLRYLGEPTDGLGDFQGSIMEHLFLNNGPLWQIVRSKKGNLTEILMTSKDAAEQKVDRLYLTVLNRPPKQSERAKFTAFLQQKGAAKPESQVEEAIWVLLNSAEFRFNH
jgi:hypothetical protein